MAVSIKIKKQQEQIDEGIIGTIIGGLFNLLWKSLKLSFGVTTGAAKGAASAISNVFQQTPEQKQLEASGQIPPEAVNVINQTKAQTVEDLKNIIQEERKNIESGRSREGNINLINRIESKCQEYKKNVEKTLISYVGKERGQQAASIYKIDTTQFENALSELTRFRAEIAKNAIMADNGLKNQIINSIKTTKIAGGRIPETELENIANILLTKAVENAKPMRTIGIGKFQTKMRENTNV
jgi:hypothetical protein